MQDILTQAKAASVEVVEDAGYRVLCILLFGNRARGDTRHDSDWDLFVITDCEPTRQEKQAVQAELSLRFAQIGFYADVILQSDAPTTTRKENTGYLTYYALKEGASI